MTADLTSQRFFKATHGTEIHVISEKRKVEYLQI